MEDYNKPVKNHCKVCDKDFYHTNVHPMVRFDGWNRPLCFSCMLRINRASEQAEASFEMSAAFGSGVDVVNVITGKRYRTK